MVYIVIYEHSGDEGRNGQEILNVKTVLERQSVTKRQTNWNGKKLDIEDILQMQLCKEFQ
jgi:hypothetical protein